MTDDQETNRKYWADELRQVRFECLTPNWDGYDSPPVEYITLIHAETFLYNLPDDVAKPDLGAEPGGLLTLEWYQSLGRLLSISIGKNNCIYYAAIYDGEKWCGHKILKGNKIPQIVLDLIRKVSIGE